MKRHDDVHNVERLTFPFNDRLPGHNIAMRTVDFPIFQEGQRVRILSKEQMNPVASVWQTLRHKRELDGKIGTIEQVHQNHTPYYYTVKLHPHGNEVLLSSIEISAAQNEC